MSDFAGAMWGFLAQQDTEPLIRWIWISDHVDEIVSRGLQHVYLTIVTVVIGFLIAFPAAVYASRHRWAVSPITSISGVLYTIPAFAFIFLLLPITGLSLTTVVIPLIAYSLLILFRNTLAGLDSVEPEVKEAAVGMGLSTPAAAVACRGAARDAGDHRGPAHRDGELDRADHDRGVDRSGRVRTVHPRRPEHVLLDAR